MIKTKSISTRCGKNWKKIMLKYFLIVHNYFFNLMLVLYHKEYAYFLANILNLIYYSISIVLTNSGM